MTNWVKENCACQPNELELVGRDVYIQRRDIEQIVHGATNGMDAYTDWECESRFITVDELNLINEIQAISNEKAIDAYTEQLIEEGIL